MYASDFFLIQLLTFVSASRFFSRSWSRIPFGIPNVDFIEKAFYAGKGSEPDAPSDGKKETPKAEDPETQEGMSPEKLAKLLTNPEVINMLKVLSKSLES